MVDDKKQKKLNKIIVLCIVLAATVIVLALFSIIFTLINFNNENIINNVKVNGVDISNLSLDETREKLNNDFSLNFKLNLKYEDYTFEIEPKDIDFQYNINKASEDAYLVGRKGNIITNNYEILKTYLFSSNVEMEYSYNKDNLDHILNKISAELPGRVINPSYFIKDENLVIDMGTKGIVISKEETKNSIINRILDSKTITNDSFDVDLSVLTIEPSKVDLDQIYKEVYSEPKDAYIEENPFKLHVAENGIDFAITLDEAKEMMDSSYQTYTIPLKIIKPKVETSDLGDKLFANTLSKYSTRYDVSNTNRSTNVELATSKLNEVIVLPGDVFSYNKTVGERTVAAGYKNASIYTMNGVENGLGGGICQVSSTLYNAVLEANLEIVERTNHRYSVSYVPLGKDATVSYGALDFRFKNTRNFPIKIKSKAQNGVLEISILGIKEENEYEVVITTEQLEVVPFETKYIKDSSLAKGTEVVKQYGYYGYKYNTYKTLLKNGFVVSKELISTDTYVPLNKIVRVGTK